MNDTSKSFISGFAGAVSGCFGAMVGLMAVLSIVIFACYVAMGSVLNTAAKALIQSGNAMVESSLKETEEVLRLNMDRELEAAIRLDRHEAEEQTKPKHPIALDEEELAAPPVSKPAKRPGETHEQRVRREYAARFEELQAIRNDRLRRKLTGE